MHLCKDNRRREQRDDHRPEQHIAYFGNKNPRLHTDEVLIALSMCAATDANAQTALDQLSKLRGCQAHTSVMLSNVDIRTFQRLGVELTSEPIFEHDKIYR